MGDFPYHNHTNQDRIWPTSTRGKSLVTRLGFRFARAGNSLRVLNYSIEIVVVNMEIEHDLSQVHV